MKNEVRENINKFIHISKSFVDDFGSLFADAGELLASFNKRADCQKYLNSPTEINYSTFINSAMQFSNEKDEAKRIQDMRSLCVYVMFVGWFFSRSVAIFTNELENELIDTTTDVALDISIFRNLRGFPVFIPFSNETKEAIGCLVSLLDEDENGVTLGFIKNDGEKWGTSISFSRLKKNTQVNLNKIVDRLIFDGFNENDAVETAIKLLYVLTERSQVNQSSFNYKPKIIKKKNRFDRLAVPNGYKPVVFGEQFTNAIREYQKQKREYESSDSTRTVRPHVRRAHWHTFLTGPRNEKRTQIVKWIPPIFVMSSEN